MNPRLSSHIAIALITVGLVALLTMGFVRDNLGEDFIGVAEDADGSHHRVYHLGSIALVFGLMALPAALLAAVLWEAVLCIAWTIRRLCRNR